MENKRGQQMTLGTIIAIVLGIAVLVFLIFGFSTGWSGLWDRITNFGGESNVDSVIQACDLACQTGSSYGFCEEGRELVTSEGSLGSKSCFEWNYRNKELGIEECPGLCSSDQAGAPYYNSEANWK